MKYLLLIYQSEESAQAAPEQEREALLGEYVSFNATFGARGLLVAGAGLKAQAPTPQPAPSPPPPRPGGFLPPR